MGGGSQDLAGALLLEQFGGGNDGAAGVDHVVDEHTGASVDVADHLLRLDCVLLLVQPPLVDDRQVGVEALGVPLRDLHPTGVR